MSHPRRATQAGYPTDESCPSAHGTSFQNPGNSALHPFYDPHPDQFGAALKNAFPHLHKPQIGSTSSITAGSTNQGLAPANPNYNFPHSSYSELANYAGDYRPVGNASEAAHAGASSTSMGHSAPSFTNRTSTGTRRASIAEPFAKGQKRKSRKSASDATAAPPGEPLGNDSDEEHAKKKEKKATQQRGYRELDKGAMKKLEDILPDEYKVNESRRNRKTITHNKHDLQNQCIEYIKDLLEENECLKTQLFETRATLEETRQQWKGAADDRENMSNELQKVTVRESALLGKMNYLQSKITFLESMWQ
ncbi:hypothetical protein DENSPDRAFT_874796 [Dentipellis sp. KUC8613]|nr:hypothetical protein DENSPDRAFT_874796 [Dentipellis sp. KUC8613]